jgi:tRNA pseudouridine55 synthase
MARAGEVVQLAAREIDVFAIEVISYEYPRLVLDVECGSGTYVRSLGRDIAEQLRTAAVMAELQRTAIGEFTIASAVDPATLTAENLAAHLLSPRLAVSGLPIVVLNRDESLRIARGQTIERVDVATGVQEFAALDERENLLAILERRGQRELGPQRNFA